MESDLLEISGEVDDDSLLLQHHQVPKDDISAFNPSLFSCSPLNFPRSKSIPPDAETKNPSVPLKVGKENINNNVHKLEVTKLNLEPQQMKRKKKGGGYNLRKSLAWNRAFFTEEGVLNSTELSLISGDFSNPSGGKLSVIEEERSESLSGDSPDLETLENNLFKQLPLNNSDKNGEKKTGSSLLQKSSVSAQRSKVKQNVLSVHDVSRSGSKRSGCPRPVISSALKRPATVSTTKAAVKEPNISKIPVPRPDSSVLSTTAKSASSVNKSKRNQSAQADVSAKRSIGLTGLKKSTRSTQSDAKSVLSGRPQIIKSSVQPTKRNGNTALASHSSNSFQSRLVTKADNGLKVNQDPVFIDGHGSINNEASSSKITSVLQSGCYIGGNSQHVQPQMPKPSGLRMPSPSLGFFTQSKCTASQNLQNNTQPGNNAKSNIPSLRKLGNSIREGTTPSMKVPVVANGVAGIKNKRMPNIESSIPSSVNSACENIRSKSKISAMEVEVCYNSNKHDLQQLHTTDKDLRQQVENVGLQCTDNKLVLQSQPSKQVNLEHNSRVDLVIPLSPDQHQNEFKDYHHLSQHCLQMTSVSKTDPIGNQLSGNEQHKSLMEDFDLLQQLHSNDVNSNDDRKDSKANDDQISSTLDSHEQPSKQEVQGKSCSFDDNQIINDIKRPDMDRNAIFKEGEPSVKLLDDGVQSYGICQKVGDHRASGLERSTDLSHHGDRVQGKVGTGEAAEFNLKIHLGDAQMHALNVDLSLESSEGNEYNLSTKYDSPVYEPVENITSCHVGSLAMLNNSSFNKQNDCEKSIGQFELILSSEACKSSPENKISEAYLNLLPAVGKTFEEFLKFNSDNREDVRPEDKSSARQAVAGHFDHSQVDCTDEPKDKCAVEAQHFDHSQVHCDHSTVEPKDKCVADEPKTDFMGNQLSGNEQHCSLMEDFDLLQQLHSNDVNRNKIDGSLKVNDDQTSMLDSHEEPSTQDEQQKFCTFGDNQIINEIENPDINRSSFVKEGESSEKLGYDGMQSYGICQKTRDCSASKLERSNDLSHHGDRVQGKDGTGEEAEFNLKIHVGDAQMKAAVHSECAAGSHNEPKESCAAGAREMTERCFEKHAHSESFDNSIQLDSCKNIIFTSAENDHFAVTVEDINEPPVLQNVVVKQILPENFRLSVNEGVSSTVKVNVSDNNHECHNEQSGRSTTLNCALPSFHEEVISGAGNTCSTLAFCSLDGESTFTTEANQTSSRENVLLEEVNHLEENLLMKSNSNLIPVEAKGITTSIEKREDDKKQEAPAVKPPPNTVPFSDEWLAALEAAGEEILTMKTGAVQHSPKDKSLPEPGPWSPVRRKNNQGVGPFDCTKFTNTNIQSGSEL